MSLFPKKMLPYAQLIRLDKPGFVYFFIPHLFGALLAASICQTPPGDLVRIILLILVATIPLAFVNYAWNDLVDADFDSRVSRTRHRPIARGAISRPSALVFTIFLALVTTTFLVALPVACSIYAVPMAFGALVYPLSKRFTDYPQVIFGFVIASGVFMGAAAFGVTPFISCPSSTTQMSPRSWIQCLNTDVSHAEAALLYLYAANVTWAIFYEIIYSFQDICDDADAGVRTITLLISRRPKPLLGLFAVLQLMLLILLGAHIQSGVMYYALSVALGSFSVAVKLWSVKLEEPESCLWWFSKGALMTGGALASGLIAEYSEGVAGKR